MTQVIATYAKTIVNNNVVEFVRTASLNCDWKGEPLFNSLSHEIRINGETRVFGGLFGDMMEEFDRQVAFVKGL